MAVAAGSAGTPLVRPRWPEIVNIGYFVSARPVLIAKAFGWFQDAAKARLVWTEMSGGAEVNSAIAGGTIDLAIGIGSLQAASGISQGIPYRMVGVEANVGGADEMTVRHAANIRKPTDFKGRRIGVPFGSTSHYRLLGFLKLHGLTLGDVTLVDLKPDPLVAAWGRSELDAAYVWSPTRGKLLAAGGDIYDTAHELDAAGYLIADLVAARGVFLEQYPETVSAMLRAYARATDLWRSKPGEAAEDVGKQLGMPADAAQAEMAELDFPALKAQSGPAWLGEHGKLAPALRRCADFLVDQRALRSAAAPAVFEKAIDPAALARAQTA